MTLTTGTHLTDPVTGYPCTVTSVTDDIVTAKVDVIPITLYLTRRTADRLFATARTQTHIAGDAAHCCGR